MDAVTIPWKKSYDIPRQHIKKQRLYFADKGLYSQSYGFSSSHVWMWDVWKSLSHVWLFATPWTVVHGILKARVPKWISSVQFSCSATSDSLWAHGLRHARLSCPWPTPRAYSNLCPLSWWCHPTISSSVVPFSSRLQSFPASGSFPMSQLLISGGQSTGVSASASVLPISIQDWFPLGLTGWIVFPFSRGSSQPKDQTQVSQIAGRFFTSWTTREAPKWKWELLSRVQLFATPRTIQSMEFSRPEYWSVGPFPSPGDLPNPGIKPGSPDSLPTEP